MYIAMQGNWVVAVKTKSAAYPQRFIITGATSGNGTYNGTVGNTVSVVGDQWSISIQHNPGTGYRGSDMRVKFPKIVGINYAFDIESNDTGSDFDFNDLILTCSTQVASDDYLVYGHVSDYSGSCFFNPCFREYLVIDTKASLSKALLNQTVKNALQQLYPQKVKTPIWKNPNPPDPVPFTPMIVNLFNESQVPIKLANIYTKTTNADVSTAPARSASKKEETNESTGFMTQYRMDKSIPMQVADSYSTAVFSYDRVKLASIFDLLPCHVEDVAYQTLRFMEYDRTTAEMVGGPYTGEGARTDLGYATTDINGNYVFRFKQSISEIINDYVPGEDALVQVRPDVIVRIMDTTSDLVLFESAPYFNVPNMKRINLCLPKSALKPARLCLNDNLLGGIGNVSIPGPPNTTFLPVARNNGITVIGTDGVLSNHDGNPNAPQIDNGCWDNHLDIKGCMNNNDALYYTIRYKLASGDWQFVNQGFHLPKHSDPSLSSPNTKVGPFTGVTLNVPGYGTGEVPYYKNVQREFFFLGIDWRYESIANIIQLSSSLYQDSPSGPVHFRIDVYNESGNQITSDLITLFIDNDLVDYDVDDAYFETSIESDCVMFALTDAEIAQPLPLKAFFKANQYNGFLQYYDLRLGKGKYNSLFPIDAASADEPKTHHTYSIALDGSSFRGTVDIFAGDSGFVEVELIPDGPWLNADQDFCTFTVNLYIQKRGQNGYFMDVSQGPKQFIFGIQRVNQ
jgi:hypothetical protein